MIVIINKNLHIHILLYTLFSDSLSTSRECLHGWRRLTLQPTVRLDLKVWIVQTYTAVWMVSGNSEVMLLSQTAQKLQSHYLWYTVSLCIWLKIWNRPFFIYLKLDVVLMFIGSTHQVVTILEPFSGNCLLMHNHCANHLRIDNLYP